MDNVNEQLDSFDKGAEIAENVARLRWEREIDRKSGSGYARFIAKIEDIRIIYAAGHHTPEQLAALYDVPEEWIYRVLPQPSIRLNLRRSLNG